jgi:hypothetical protein
MLSAMPSPGKARRLSLAAQIVEQNAALLFGRVVLGGQAFRTTLEWS